MGVLEHSLGRYRKQPSLNILDLHVLQISAVPKMYELRVGQELPALIEKTISSLIMLHHQMIGQI